jgi:hypothetical protein
LVPSRRRQVIASLRGSDRVSQSRRSLAPEHLFDYNGGMDRRLELEQLRRSIAMLSPGARDAIGREDALRLLTELHDV